MILFSASFDPNYPNLKQSLLLTFLYITSFALFFFLISVLPRLLGWQLPPVHIIVFLYICVGSTICIIPLIIYVSLKSGIPIKWKLKSPGIQLILLVSLLALSSRLILQPLYNPVDYFNTLIGGRVRLFNFNLPEFNLVWVISSIFIVLIVPIFEEIFWRKQILGLF